MAKPNIVVVDYHKGNLSSVARGLDRAGASAFISDDPAQIVAADAVVLPGVGSFYDAIAFMHASGQGAAVLQAIEQGKPFLGICLGLQLLFSAGDEGVPEDVPAQAFDDPLQGPAQPGEVFTAQGKRWVSGLGVIQGTCTRLEPDRLKVPHVGWDQVHVSDEGRTCPLLSGFPEGANMYFTHSYAVAGDMPASAAAARTHYVRSFPSVVAQGNVFACQFHPEKSSARGLDILKNFVAVADGKSGAR